MVAYHLKSPISAAVICHQQHTVSMQLPAASKLQVLEPSQKVHGLNAGYKRQRLAVLPADSKLSRNRNQTTGSKHSQICVSQLLSLQGAYSKALRDYTDILCKRTLAVVTGDHALARQLIASQEEIADSCRRAKTALQEHEALGLEKLASATA